eukprot:TRINITY_DN4236_c0_g1_i2.p1 TRINITY_DN4236_c0_g1~~TRINITY_DN4236_c0_g1_i2.p1  ORF type:complete len:238 (-),score=59.67 TRINITY_DN4236_c0_g1_i2:29-742(-)
MMQNRLTHTSEEVMDKVNSSVENYSQGDVSQVDAINMLPPHNAKTKDVSAIYPLSSVIADYEIKDVEISEFKATIENSKSWNEAIKSSKYEKIIIDAVASQRASKKGKTPLFNDAQYKYLLYLSYMIKYYIYCRKTKVDESILPGSVWSCLKKKFRTDYGGGTMTPLAKNALLAHIIILSLHIHHYKIDASILADDLAMKTTLCIEAAKAVGCKRIDSASHDVKLTAPLSLPSLARR